MTIATPETKPIIRGVCDHCGNVSEPLEVWKLRTVDAWDARDVIVQLVGLNWEIDTMVDAPSPLLYCPDCCER
jgi:hypothetical protein